MSSRDGSGPEVGSEGVLAGGIWAQVFRGPEDRSLRPALFLDRDGVIVDEVGYLRHPQDVRLIARSAEVIVAANRANLPVVVVSNQSGVGRGLFDWADFAAVQRRIARDLASRGAFVDALLACPCHAEARPPYRHPDHPARKPNPGMLKAAADLLPIDLSASWIIGDRASDLAAGSRGGLAGGILVLGGLGTIELEACQPLANATFRVFAVPEIGAALSILPLAGGSVGPAAPAERISCDQARP